MNSRSKTFSFLLLLLFAVTMPSFASGGTCNPPGAPAVYTINSSNGRLLQVDFDNQCVDVINNDANKIKQANDIVVTQSATAGTGIVVVAKGRVCIYQLGGSDPRHCQTITNDIPRGVSVTVASNGDLIVANSHPGNGKGNEEALYRITRDDSEDTGYSSSAELIVSDLPCDRVEQIRSAPFSVGLDLATDDVLATCEVPPAVYRFSRGLEDMTLFTDDFDSAGPTGVAFGPDQSVYIAETSGRIRRFDAAGNSLSPDFSNEIGNGAVRLAAGPDTRIDDVTKRTISIVLATQLNGGTIHRFKVVSDGGDLVGELEDSVTGFVSSPSGADCTTCRSVPIKPGVPTATAPGLESTYEVFDDIFGYASGRAILIEESALGAGLNRNLSNVPGLQLPNVKVPEHMVGMPRVNSPGKWFLLYQMTSSIDVAPGTVLHHANELEFDFDIDDTCDLPFNMSPQAAYAPELALHEPPVVEGNVFANLDHGCSPAFLWRGFSRGSLYLAGFDSRRPIQMALDKCETARFALGDIRSRDLDPDGVLADAFHPRLLAAATGKLDAACRAIEYGRKQRALGSLEDLIELMNQHKDLVDNTERNVTGEVVVRTKSIVSTICRGIRGRRTPSQCTTLLP